MMKRIIDHEKIGVIFITVILLASAWTCYNRQAQWADVKAEAADRTELVMAEINAQLEAQDDPEYSQIYRDIFAIYEEAVVSAERGVMYILPDELPFDTYEPPRADDPLFKEIEIGVNMVLAQITSLYTSADAELRDRCRCFLYPAIRAKLQLQKEMELDDPLEREVQEQCDHEMIDFIHPQLISQNGLDKAEVLRDVIYDQIRYSVYKDHGVNLNEFA